MTKILVQMLEDLQINQEELIKEFLLDIPKYVSERTVYDVQVHNWAVLLGLQGQKRKALQTLLSRRGYGFKEITRLMRLHQLHKALILMQSQKDDVFSDREDEEPFAKTICHFLLTGSLDTQPRAGQEQFLAQIIPEQMKIQVINYDKYASHLIIEILENQFYKRMQQANSYLLEYVQRHRRQAYVYLFHNQLLNEDLIEMDIQQMCRILILPTDYFNDYFQMTFQTLLYLHLVNGQITGSSLLEESTQSCLKDLIKFEIQSRSQIDNRVLESQLHNGLVKAIVKKKVQFQKHLPEGYADRLLRNQLKSDQQISGFLDGMLIYRNMKRNNDPVLISDLIYDVLIYKLP